MQKKFSLKFLLLTGLFLCLVIIFDRSSKYSCNRTFVETELDITSATVAPAQATLQNKNGTVALRNMIDKKMITYHKGFFSLTPEFTLTVNDQVVKPKESVTASMENGIVEVAYAYNFMGHKKGKKSIRFKIPADKEHLDITFSWKKDPRIIVNGAEALEVKELY